MVNWWWAISASYFGMGQQDNAGVFDCSTFFESDESALPSAAITSNGVVTESAFKTYKNAVIAVPIQIEGFFRVTRSPQY